MQEHHLDNKKWFLCPYCNKKLVKYEKDAISKGVFLLCKKCGKEIEIRINKSLNWACEPD
mgnify:CR=1 FL=1